MATIAKNPSLFLKRRPPLEAPFSATLRALGRSSLADATHGGGQHDPLVWIFRAEALQGLSRAEQGLVLDGNAAMDGSVTVTSAVDTRLVLEQSAKSFSRERLQGLKLLFGWADVRDRAVTPKVASTVANGLQAPGQRQEKHEGEEAKEEAKEEGWWIRNSVIEALKGQVFLAARENVAG
ncbi:hypothetical protein BN1723_006014 [Verticillium longisporum]|nr:hypothetical protein BN1723_006014 [Verticillium longisporum]